MESKLKNKRGELASEKEHQKKSSSGCLAPFEDASLLKSRHRRPQKAAAAEGDGLREGERAL